MPVYHLTTPDSDDESDESREGLGGFIPLSASALVQVTGDRTSKWLEDVLKCTISQSPVQIAENVDIGLEKRNTINVKRYRVFSTTVDIHQKKPTEPERVETQRLGREAREEAPSSWIASEIFNTASQAAEPRLQTSEKSVAVAKRQSAHGNVNNYGGYDEIESLMEDYFEDLKERGSDCRED